MSALLFSITFLYKAGDAYYCFYEILKLECFTLLCYDVGNSCPLSFIFIFYFYGEKMEVKALKTFSSVFRYFVL